MRVRRYGILLAVLLVSLLLLTVQTRGGGTGRAGDLVTVAVTPIQSLLVRIHRGALNLWANYVDWKSVRRDNAALREENEQLRVQSCRPARPARRMRACVACWCCGTVCL